MQDSIELGLRFDNSTDLNELAQKFPNAELELNSAMSGLLENASLMIETLSLAVSIISFLYSTLSKDTIQIRTLTVTQKGRKKRYKVSGLTEEEILRTLKSTGFADTKANSDDCT